MVIEEIYELPVINCEDEINNKITEYQNQLKSYYVFKHYYQFLNSIIIVDGDVTESPFQESENQPLLSMNDTSNQRTLNSDIFKIKLMLSDDVNCLFSSPSFHYTPKDILLAPMAIYLNQNLEMNYRINIQDMTLPMFNVHKSNSQSTDDFIYVITGEETGVLKDFLTRVELLDKQIKGLLQQYIKTRRLSSPLTSLFQRNDVTENDHWSYRGLIHNLKSGQKALHISYRRFSAFSLIEEDDKEGTMIYIGNEPFEELMNLLSLNSYCFVDGQLCPIFRVEEIWVRERTKPNADHSNILFQCKAYFTEIFFKPDTVHCTTEEKL